MAEQLKYEDNNYRFPGDFRCDGVLLYSYEGFVVDISDNVAVINIYQSLEENFITGNILFFDIVGLSHRLPIVGQEFLEFRMRSPFDAGGDEQIDHKTHRFQVYKKASYKTSASAQALILHFTSIEMTRNQRVRVSKTFNQSYGRTVNDIVKNKEYLNSKKFLFISETKNNYKINIPNLRPTDAINMLADRSEPKDHLGPGYLFFENNRGLHYRCLDDLYAEPNGTPKPPKHYYDLVSAEKPSFVPVSDEVFGQISKPMTYTLNNNMDSVLNTRKGMFANKVYSHDLYSKQWDVSKFNYANSYLNESRHIEAVREYKYQGIMAPGPAEFDDVHNNDDNTFGLKNKKQIEKLNNTPLGNNGSPRRKMLSDYYDSRIMLESNTKKLYNSNADNGFNLPKIRQNREQILGMYNYLSMTLDVPGNFTLNVGDIAYCDVPSFEAQGKGNNPNKPIEIDPSLTGRYLITDVHHQIDFVERSHTSSIRLARDIFAQPYLPPNFEGKFLTAVNDPVGAAIDTATLQSFKDVTKLLKIPTPRISTVEDLTSELGIDINTPINEIKAAAAAAGKTFNIDFNTSSITDIRNAASSLGINVNTQLNKLSNIQNVLKVGDVNIYGMQNAANTSISGILNSTTNRVLQNTYAANVVGIVADRQNVLSNILSKTTGLNLGGLNLPSFTNMGINVIPGIGINVNLNSFVRSVSTTFKTSVAKVGSFIKGFF